MHPILVSIMLLLAGLAFIFVELFIPSAGLISIVSGSLLIAGIVVGFNAGPVAGFSILGLTLVTAPVTVSFLLKVWPHTSIGRRLFISPPKAEDVEPDRVCRALAEVEPFRFRQHAERVFDGRAGARSASV